MAKSIEAVFEDGVLKSLSPLNFKKYEKVKIFIERAESVARSTNGLIKGLDDKIINELAQSPEFLPEEA
ncbi:MAG: antitoxin family protein [Nitrospirae bacterium]|nr:antitoxin family protein [Nitrospirota bacterium]